MALIPDRVSFVRAVGLIVQVDMGIVNDVFNGGTPKLNTTEEIKYDSAVVEGVAPAYRSFSESAKVITKDGKDVVSLKPVQFNNAIDKETIDADAVQFGQNEYGEGTVDAVMEAALTGVAKLHLNRLVGTKKIAYEALTTHKIANGYIGKNGVEDIVFAVPAANKEVFDGTTLKYWSNSASTPLDDIIRAYDAMKIKPTHVIMNQNTYANFLANDQVCTFDNITTGMKRNYVENDNAPVDADYYRAGRVMYKGRNIDVFVEKGSAYDGVSAYAPFMPDKYVVYASRVGGEMHYGGIPVADNAGIRRIAAEYDTREIVRQDPPQHHVTYRSAPLPVLKNGHAFFSQKVEA